MKTVLATVLYKLMSKYGHLRVKHFFTILQNKQNLLFIP